MADLFPEISYAGGVDGAPAEGETGWTTFAPPGLYEADAGMFASMGLRITTQGVYRRTIVARNSGRIRWFYRVPVIAPGANVTIVPFRNGSTVLCGVRHESAGTLCLIAGASKVGSSTGALVAGQEIRGEFAWAGDGSLLLELWRGSNLHSVGVPDDSVSAPAASWAGTNGDNIGACFPTIVTDFVSDWGPGVRATDDPITRIGSGFTQLPSGVWTYGQRVQIGG